MKFLTAIFLFALVACSKEPEPVTPNPDFYDVRLISDAIEYPYLIDVTVGSIHFTDSLYAEKPSGDGLDTTFMNVPAETFIKLKAMSDLRGNAMKIRIIYGQDKHKAILYPNKPMVELEMVLP